MPQYNRSIVILQRKLLWIFGKQFIYENLKKKLNHFITNIFYNIEAIDILKFYEVLFETLPTTGNEKQQ